MCGRDLPAYPHTSERANHPLIPNITRTRIAQFFNHDYASQHVARLRDRARFGGPDHVRLTCWSAPGMDKPTFVEGCRGLRGESAREIAVGHQFGPSWSNHWVKVEIIIPEEFAKSGQEVLFEFDCSGEALILSEEGHALHGLTGTPANLGDDQDFRRTEHVIPKDAVQVGTYTVYIEVSCNGLFGAGRGGMTLDLPDMELTFPLLCADVVLPDIDIRAMQVDFRMLRQISASTQNQASDLPRRAMKAANEMMNAWHRVPGDEEDRDLLKPVVVECRRIGWEVLGSLTDEDRANLCPSLDDPEPAEIWAIGHCHIDTAWLWRYTQTQQKVVRSWTTQCDLMDRWANHQFAASSAQQYLWLEQLYPESFDRIKKYVGDNRFHPVGGAWLEHDSNLPSGESLVRQYLYGQRFFKSRFGEYCREAWLPDSFGYSSQLPQILRSAGLQYFFTQKLSWNNINVFPYTTFNWVGLDGSQVLAHLAPSDTYNAQCNFDELEMGIYNNKNIADVQQSLMLYGNGDGGGGPTPEHIEKLERLSSLAKKDRNVPSIKIGKPVDFFDSLLRATEGGRTLPTWRGELYLEFHRGTYTTQAGIKEGNKTMERLLRDLEYFATLATLKGGNYQYPREELRDMWQDTLLNQFHDVLPGSVISLVVQDALEIYRKRTRQARQLIEAALLDLYPASQAVNQFSTGQDVIAIDPLRGSRTEAVYLGDGVLRLRDGTVDEDASLLTSSVTMEDNTATLENEQLRMSISNGRISSVFDKRIDRELIKAGPGAESGGLNLYEDIPLEWDAWDVEIYHLQSYQELLFNKVEKISLPRFVGIKSTAYFGKSIAELTFSLDSSSSDSSCSFIRIQARFDWHEEHKCLKFVLPLDIHSASATYGTQFGIISRPTHRNTSHEWAKFEVCGHMFGDLSEPGYGVALVSAWKYGYAIEGNVARLTLLRAPMSPDPTADRGKHQFDLAIMPHTGFFEDSHVYQSALEFCNPVYVRTTSPHAPVLPKFAVSQRSGGRIILETIKLAEDSNDLILRIYEAMGGRTKGQLTVQGVPVSSAQYVDILERPVGEASAHKTAGGVAVDLDLRGFEIRTLKLTI